MKFNALQSLIVSLIILVFAEQSFLFFYANRLSERQGEVIQKYIDSIDGVAGQPSGNGSYAHRCEWATVAYVYKFKICSTYCHAEDDSGCILVRVQHPAGFLSLIPRSYPDRIIFDGANILLLDGSGKIVEDLRTY